MDVRGKKRNKKMREIKDDVGKKRKIIDGEKVRGGKRLEVVRRMEQGRVSKGRKRRNDRRGRRKGERRH